MNSLLGKRKDTPSSATPSPPSGGLRPHINQDQEGDTVEVPRLRLQKWAEEIRELRQELSAAGIHASHSQDGPDDSQTQR
jgi:hypothetical protein